MSATVISDPGHPRIQAVFLRAHVRMRKAGMKHSKITAEQLRHKVQAVTGDTYKSGDWDRMLQGLNAIIALYNQET
jgi:hypothetical protein